MFAANKLALAVCLLGLSATVVTHAQETQPAVQPFPDFSIPANADVEKLESILSEAKSVRPKNNQQYQAMQTAIRDCSKRLMTILKSTPESERYQQAELDMVSASVALMTFFGEDAKAKTLAQIKKFLNGRRELSLADVRTGMLAAAMLELQPNKNPAREIYQLLSELLEEDEREAMQSLRLNLQAAIRRLDLLGSKFELSARSLDGTPIRTDDFNGKFVIVDFFATWCEPCLAELPRLKKHYQKYHDRGLDVIGISLDEDSKALQKFLKTSELPWPIIHDNAQDPLKRLQMQFGVSQLPTVLLLNKEGTVVSLEARGGELNRLMQMLFEAPTPAPAPQSDTNAATPAAASDN